jgi:nicotinamidase-related amidase
MWSDDYLTPDKDHAALVSIDTQRDFTLSGAPAEIPGTLAALLEMERLVQAFRDQSKPIVHVVRLYLSDGSNVDLCRRRTVQAGNHLVAPGTAGAEIMDHLKPSPMVRLDADLVLSGRFQAIGPQEWIMYKPRWGAFYQTHLREHLHGLGVNSIVLCGCNFPNCPRTTIYEASERDFKIVLIIDAISGLYEKGKEEMRNIGVTLMDTETCLAWLM